jgi:twitching motility protein PilT
MDVDLLHKLLVSAVQKGASDIHLQVGYAPLMRLNGELLEVKYRALQPADTRRIVEEILKQSYANQDLDRLSELDISYSVEGHGRFRVNIFRQRGSFGVVLRVIPITIPPFSELNLPSVVEQISNLRRGLVLVVGATGMGKSTTLAAMVEFINNNRRSHIVTVEDPIEFLFKHKRSVISQREVGTDTPSHTVAAVAAMRQDPDVIFIGEMREAETVDVALKAAETGHLVLTSMHTTNAINSIARLLGFFAPDQEPAIRKRIADCLMCVIALRLLPRKDQPGRIPAVEIMRVTRTIQECIRDPAKTAEIAVHMQKGSDIYGMQTFDQHLLELVRENKVDIQVAKVAATNEEELERSLMIE